MSTTLLDRRIRAPPSVVYRALLDAQAVQQWMAPDGMTSEVHVFDSREGGEFRISLTYDLPTTTGKTSAQTDSFHGRSVELVPDSKVVQVVEFESDDPSPARITDSTARRLISATVGPDSSSVGPQRRTTT